MDKGKGVVRCIQANDKTRIRTKDEPDPKEITFETPHGDATARTGAYGCVSWTTAQNSHARDAADRLKAYAVRAYPYPWELDNVLPVTPEKPTLLPRTGDIGAPMRQLIATYNEEATHRYARSPGADNLSLSNKAREHMRRNPEAFALALQAIKARSSDVALWNIIKTEATSLLTHQTE
ncbi:hypothetical protein QQS21_000024 [Conoideocrella luteorostrata]|uniref:Uncharacterized protein n=1 Tax=Conoideocrella luteorostrata TaxID=1105319 RepID=A0AAJ0D1N0_9HYPO|nr:hypothetical protein QQS21_000024 [Conoideocrella luteorostrata]